MADEGTEVARLNEIVEADADLLDRVNEMREEGFEPYELVLISLAADPTFIEASPGAYKTRLNEMGIPVTRHRVVKALKREEVRNAINDLVATIVGDVGEWAVWKNLIQVAKDPKHSQCVAASRLILHARGKLKHNNDAPGTPESDSFARMVRRNTRRVTVRERHYEAEYETGDGSPHEGTPPSSSEQPTRRARTEDPGVTVVDNVVDEDL